MSPKDSIIKFFKSDLSPITLKIIIIVLFSLVFLSLALNWILISQLLQARQQALAMVQELKPLAQEALSKIDTELAAFQTSNITFKIELDQEFPIQVDIPINESVDVPINVIIPIKKEVQTTMILDPLQSGLLLPVDVTVPVDEEIPIDVVIPVAVKRTIPISTTVPLNLDVPITIAVSETDLVQYVEQLRQGIATLEASLEQVILDEEE